MVIALVGLALLIASPLAWAEPSAHGTPPPLESPVEAPPPVTPTAPPDPNEPVAPKDTTPRFYIQEFRVDGGGKLLTADEI